MAARSLHPPAVKPDTRSFYTRAVQRAIENIVDDLASADTTRALDLHSLASEARLSPFHFHRVFRGMTGETPLGLRRRLSMERAAWQLARTPRPVTEIAFEAGYETHESFSRAFRAIFCTSPSGYRRGSVHRFRLAATSGIHFDPAGSVPAFTPRDSGGRSMDVTLEELDEQRIATVRHVGPYNQIARAFEKLGAAAHSAGLIGLPGSAMLAIYHDDPESTPPDQLRSEAGLVIDEDTPIPPELTEQRIPAGRYLRAVHRGSYENLGDTWARFMGEWLPASDHRVGPGAPFELYRNNPMDTPVDQLRTEIYVPIA